MKKRLTRLEMAAQLREEAAELIRLAIELEGSHPAVQPEVTEHFVRQEAVTMEELLELMDGKMRRKQDLADKLMVPIQQLDKIMTRENGFVMTERGWWKYTGSHRAAE